MHFHRIDKKLYIIVFIMYTQDITKINIVKEKGIAFKVK